MPVSETGANWSLEIIVAVLRASRLLVWLSLLFTAVALTPWSGMATGWLRVAIVALGFGALWFGVRIAIDEHLFRRLLTLDANRELDAFDESLARLGWAQPDKLGRPLGARIQGAMRLVWWLAALVVAQGLMAVSVFWAYS